MSSLNTLRETFAILVGAIALAGAVFLGAAHLKMHGNYHCSPGPSAGSCVPFYSYWTVGRAWWQIPAAIAVAVFGVGVAFVLTKR